MSMHIKSEYESFYLVGIRIIILEASNLFSELECQQQAVVL